MTELNNSFETNLETADVERTAIPPRVMRVNGTRRLVWSGAFLVILLVAALIGWWNLPPTLHGIVMQSPRVAEDFTLATSRGEAMSLSDLRGKYVVLFFGYTFCPDVCPTTLNDLQQMVKTLGYKACR